MCRTILAVLILVATVPVRADEKPDYKAMKEKWEERVKAAKETATAKLREKYADLEKKLDAEMGRRKKATTVKAKDTSDRLIAGVREVMADTERAISRAEARVEYDQPSQVAVGYFGKVSPNAFRVVQVVGPMAALASQGQQTFWVETDTGKLFDGATINMEGFVYCPRTQKYTAVDGATRTVPVVRPVTEKELGK